MHMPTWMDFGNMYSERNQTEKIIYCMIPSS